MGLGVARYDPAMILALALASLALSTPPVVVSAREDPAPAARPERVLVPGTRVRLAPPAGHERGRGFLGYQWPEMGSSLIVVEIPSAYAELANGMDEKGLAKGGMKLVEAKDVKVGSRDGRLILVTQDMQGIPMRKALVLVGDEKRTCMLNASSPAELEVPFFDELKNVLLAAEWDPKLEVDPFAALDWTVAKPEGLKFAANLGTALLYTEDGEVVQKDTPGSARLTISPSTGAVEVSDARTFAEARLKKLPYGRAAEIESSTELRVGERAAWEIVAKARDEKAGIDLLVHQVLVVGEGEYHLFVAQCAAERRDAWLPRFRDAARSLRPAPAPAPAAKEPETK